MTSGGVAHHRLVIFCQQCRFLLLGRLQVAFLHVTKTAYAFRYAGDGDRGRQLVGRQLGQQAGHGGAVFADQRTYIYNGKEVDQQTHLGFDLAVTANVPVLAANSGKVVNADWLGIYGNCVVIDHGLGVSSLYGHLSSIDVKVGDTVSKGQVLGRSGMTGLAGGDHLHFTMLVGGHPVNPVEWWDSHWIQDRVERKLRDAGAPAPAPAATR